MKVLPCQWLVVTMVLLTGAAISADDAAELRERAIAMRRESAELLANGHDEESNRLTKESMMLLEKAHQVAAQAGKKDSSETVEVAALHERLQDLKVAHAEAVEASGPEQQVKELEEKIDRVKKELAELSVGSKVSSPPDRDREARNKKLELAMRRVRHLRIAAENLKAAEMHDLAHEVMKKADILEQEVHAFRATERGHQDNQSNAALAAELRELKQENERLRNALQEWKQNEE